MGAHAGLGQAARRGTAAALVVQGRGWLQGGQARPQVADIVHALGVRGHSAQEM